MSQNEGENSNLGEISSTWGQEFEETTYDKGNSRLSLLGKDNPWQAGSSLSLFLIWKVKDYLKSAFVLFKEDLD
ncbi:hypothetical protein Patl1_15746 [Pistacia atlantica]|uniref:Uncharacterized protein n=2 Tax=Pistacia atlantica TaxID=434234 RepID=A0ACC1BAT5_9ROSI|nr:hypothetical protein Patl1_15750 [Pistacia atlantica]KAJ0095962.1 hypothetical protein Patl1_15746 [Pistacia atlantica]